MSDRYFDDFLIGDKFTSASTTISESQIVEFAKVYDPQGFHIDPVAAAQTIYGGIIASGFQTLALGFRLAWDTGVYRAASMGSPGMDTLRWIKPVRPGDTLRVEFEVTDKRPSRSKPDRGALILDYRYLNQRDEVVVSFTSIHLMRRRG